MRHSCPCRSCCRIHIECDTAGGRLVLHAAAAIAMVPPPFHPILYQSEGEAMSRPLGILCAGVLVLATSGCTLDSFFLFGGSSRREIVVVGSVSQCASSLQASLNQRNIMVTQQRNGEEVRLSGVFEGKKFAFILQKQKSDTGEKTVIAFEGENDSYEKLWTSAVIGAGNGTQLQQPSGPGNGSPNANLNTQGNPPMQDPQVVGPIGGMSR